MLQISTTICVRRQAESLFAGFGQMLRSSPQACSGSESGMHQPGSLAIESLDGTCGLRVFYDVRRTEAFQDLKLHQWLGAIH